MILRQLRSLTVVLFLTLPLLSDAKTLAIEPNLSLTAVEIAIESIKPDVRLPHLASRGVVSGAKVAALQKFVSNFKTGVANANRFAKVFARNVDVWRRTEVSFDPHKALPLALDTKKSETIDPRDVLKVAIAVAESVVATSAEIALPEFKPEEKKIALPVVEEESVVVERMVEEDNAAATLLAQSNLQKIIDAIRSSLMNTAETTSPPAPVLQQVIPASQIVTRVSLAPDLGTFGDRFVTLDSFDEQIARVYDSMENNSELIESLGPLTLSGALTGTSASFSGLLTLTGATTTASNGFDITDGCFSIDGVCLSAGGGLASADIDSSLELLNLVTNETGTGSLVFGTIPTLVGFLSTASSTLQNFTFTTATGTSATTTNFFSTTLFSTTFNNSGLGTLGNLLLSSSSTLQNFTFINATGTSATTTNFFATTASTSNLFAAAFSLGGNMTHSNVSTTTIPTAAFGWTIATSTSAGNGPVMAFNNISSTSTITFFSATTTGLVAGQGLGIPSASKQMLIVGDGKTQAGISIVKGGICVDSDGWCTASTTGRISSVTSTTGGSDLAENYISDEPLEAGDLVSSAGGISVTLASEDSREHLMGVVSTEPGIILGLPTDENLNTHGKFPIALSGRVPAKVNTENGSIDHGDYLTLSSVPGVAAKALKAGIVIGQALESYSGDGTGKIEVFIKNSYYSGLSADSLPGLVAGSLSDSDGILAALMEGALNTGGRISNISTDTLLAGIEIITPKLTAHLVKAEVIESPTIDALVARISMLENVNQSSINLASAIQSITEWVVTKVTAVLGIFERIETKTAKVTEGIELTDSATGDVYCMTLKNGEWDKDLGSCGSEDEGATESSGGPEPESVPAEELEPVIEEPEAPAEESVEPEVAPEEETVQPELEATPEPEPEPEPEAPPTPPENTEEAL